MTADTRTTEFAKFIRTASAEEKEKVFNAVMDKSIEAQLTSIDVQEKSDKDYPEPPQEFYIEGSVDIGNSQEESRKRRIKAICRRCGYDKFMPQFIEEAE